MIPIQYLDATPELTGDVSTDAWAKLLWHEQFTTPARPNAQPTPGTSFAMAHDGDSLFFAVKCKALAGEAPEELARENVQIQLDSERRGLRSGIFVCYTDGKASSAIELEADGKEAWLGEVGYGSRLQAGGWSMVLKVPLSQLAHVEEGLQRIQFNVTRVLRAHGAPESLLSYPAQKNIHFWRPSHATGEAEFEEPERLKAYAWAVRRAGRGRLRQNSGDTASPEPGRMVCLQGVVSTNLSNTVQDVDLRAEFIEAGKAPSARTERRLRISAGASHLENIEFPVPDGFNYGLVHVSLHEPDSGRCLSENRILVDAEELSWKEHFVKRGDGQGGYTCLAAQQQVLPLYDGCPTVPHGLATMDNGEVMCAAITQPLVGGQPEQTLITFSADGGATWAEYIVLDGIHTRPMMLVYLGRGEVTFESGDTTEQLRLYSHDYGRTWDERVAAQPAPDGQTLGFEGSPLVDRDEQGNAIRIAQTGQTLEGAAPNYKIREYIRWSEDGGRTWPRVDSPEAWRTTETYDGKTFDFSCNEGALVRAANGDLVAALRTWVPPEFHHHPYFVDCLEGTAVSISKDDGATWSPNKMLFEGGRHHPTLLRMANGDLVMVLIRRIDFSNGKLVSYRRGCDAVISRDHGETWDVEHLYVLDDFLYCKGEDWMRGACGHISSTLLPDGSILTGYGRDNVGGVLIRWKP
jgi:hypothetical protein